MDDTLRATARRADAIDSPRFQHPLVPGLYLWPPPAGIDPDVVEVPYGS